MSVSSIEAGYNFLVVLALLYTGIFLFSLIQLCEIRSRHRGNVWPRHKNGVLEYLLVSVLCLFRLISLPVLHSRGTTSDESAFVNADTAGVLVVFTILLICPLHALLQDSLFRRLGVRVLYSELTQHAKAAPIVRLRKWIIYVTVICEVAAFIGIIAVLASGANSLKVLIGAAVGIVLLVLLMTLSVVVGTQLLSRSHLRDLLRVSRSLPVEPVPRFVWQPRPGRLRGDVPTHIVENARRYTWTRRLWYLTTGVLVLMVVLVPATLFVLDTESADNGTREVITYFPLWSSIYMVLELVYLCLRWPSVAVDMNPPVRIVRRQRTAAELEKAAENDVETGSAEKDVKPKGILDMSEDENAIEEDSDVDVFGQRTGDPAVHNTETPPNPTEEPDGPLASPDSASASRPVFGEAGNRPSEHSLPPMQMKMFFRDEAGNLVQPSPRPELNLGAPEEDMDRRILAQTSEGSSRYELPELRTPGTTVEDNSEVHGLLSSIKMTISRNSLRKGLTPQQKPQKVTLREEPDDLAHRAAARSPWTPSYQLSVRQPDPKKDKKKKKKKQKQSEVKRIRIRKEKSALEVIPGVTLAEHDVEVPKSPLEDRSILNTVSGKHHRSDGPGTYDFQHAFIGSGSRAPYGTQSSAGYTTIHSPRNTASIDDGEAIPEASLDDVGLLSFDK